MLGKGVRLVRRHWLATLIVANAVALLCFRHFVSLDGPMYLLHAAVQKDAWLGITREAQGIRADASVQDLNLGDLLLIPLVGVVCPFFLHKLLAVVAVTSVCLGAWRLACAYGRVNAAWVLVLPCSFGFVLILGLFHFMIGSGLAMGGVGWWVSRRAVRWKEPGLLVLLCALATFAHTACGALLLLLVATNELVILLGDRVAWRSRWAALPGWLVPALVCVSVIIALGAIATRFSGAPVQPHEPHHPVRELLTLRPLLLLDSASEQPFRIAIGAVLLALIGLAMVDRLKHGVRQGDGLLACAILLLLISFIRTPRTELMYITDRAQWLALLLVACWLSTRPLPVRPLLVFAAAVIALHTARQVFFERRMADLRPRDRAVRLAGTTFEPDALVIPVVLGNDWLARHITAYAAVRHRGLVFTGRDHLRFAWGLAPEAHVRNYILSPENDWTWIGDHNRDGLAPDLRQILVVGEADKSQLPTWNTLLATLKRDYTLTTDQVYAQVWTRKTGP